MDHRTISLAASLVVSFALLAAGGLQAAPVAVRQAEGVVHGFLALRTLDGKTIADGDLIQVARGSEVTSRLLFRFHDGSIHDDTVVFTQRRTFRLVSDHLVQKGPSFPQPIEVTVDGRSGKTTVRYVDDGKEKTVSERLKLPADVANGIMLTLLKNLPPGSPGATFALVAAAPKPRLVKLVVSSAGEASFAIGGSSRKAQHYVVKVEIGGIAGAIAPLIGKQPTDTHVWILGGEAPAFVRMEGTLYPEGPIWRIDLTSPTWP